MSYNRQLVAERLKNLRKQNNKKIPLIKLSEEIEEKTEVYISATQLNKYENPEKSDIMNVENLIAIADYYDVPYEYLLGKSESKKRENINIHERTGLSDNAINNIMKYKEPFFPVQTNQYGFIPALNKFLENSEFCEFLILLGSYYNNLVDIERHKRDNPGSKITMYGHKFPGPNGKIILNVYEYAEYMRMRFKTMLAEAGSKAVSDYFKFLQEEAQKAIEEER